MARVVPDEKILEIKQATDIVELVSQYFPLKRSGKNYKALCPFHLEKTPSFSVSSEKQIYYCFGCGEGGNVISFVMAMEKIGFLDAVKLLAERAGISLLFEEGSGPDKARLFGLLEWANHFYESVLHNSPAGAPALEYLKKRGIHEESIRKFQLGFSPSSWDSLYQRAKKRGFTHEELQEAGLCLQGKKGLYDRFRARIVFPIFDATGRVIGFGGRAMGEEELKYINSPETSLFSKGNTLYGLSLAKKGVQDKGAVAVVEGYTDVILAHQNGFHNFVATLGTSLTPAHSRLLKRHTDRVLIVFDGDTAGERASKRGIEVLLDEDLEVQVVELPQGLDPCEFLVSKGAGAFQVLMENAKGFLDYSLNKVLSGEGRMSVEAKLRGLRAILQIVGGIHSPLKREIYIKEIAEKTGVREETIRSALLRRTLSSRAGEEEKRTDSPSTTFRAEEEIIEAVLHEESILEEVDHRSLFRAFCSEENKKILGEIVRQIEEKGEVVPADLFIALKDHALEKRVAALLVKKGKPYREQFFGSLQYLERAVLDQELKKLSEERKGISGEENEEELNRLLEATLEKIKEKKSKKTRTFD